MNIGESLRITVSEPWDFASSDGDNMLKCTIKGIIRKDENDLYLAKSNSFFLIDGVPIDYLVLHYRDEKNEIFNIYCIEDFNCKNPRNVSIHAEKMKLILIGTRR